jgi:hypothetical protein
MHARGGGAAWDWDLELGARHRVVAGAVLVVEGARLCGQVELLFTLRRRAGLVHRTGLEGRLRLGAWSKAKRLLQLWAGA